MFNRTNFSTEEGLLKGCLRGDRAAETGQQLQPLAEVAAWGVGLRGF